MARAQGRIGPRGGARRARARGPCSCRSCIFDAVVLRARRCARVAAHGLWGCRRRGYLYKGTWLCRRFRRWTRLPCFLLSRLPVLLCRRVTPFRWRGSTGVDQERIRRNAHTLLRTCIEPCEARDGFVLLHLEGHVLFPVLLRAVRADEVRASRSARSWHPRVSRRLQHRAHERARLRARADHW